MDSDTHKTNDYIPRPCPICGNNRPELIQFVEPVNTVLRILCKCCDTIYFDRDPGTWPVYDKAYNMHFFRPCDIQKAGIMAAKLATLIQGRWKNPNILEAGSGNGLTVLLLRAMGFNTFGVDLDPKLSVYLMELCKIPVLACRFEEFTPPAKYHLIYSSHVIEHCKNPEHFMRKAFALLEDAGLFYIDTPDTQYYTAEGKRWHHFETRNPYEHCCLFGRTGLTLLAHNCGFKTVKHDSFPEYMSQHIILKK